MDKNKRNKIIGLSIGILIVLIIVVSSTYAYWQVTRTQETPNDIVAACLDITMQNESGTFGLDKAWPISDSEGEALTGYTFEVKNNCDENVNYIVGLNSVAGSSDNYLDYSSLRLKLDDKQSSLISELGDIGYSDPENKETVRDSKLLSMESLEGKGTATHNVKVWIDSEAPVSEQGKIFRGQIFITGGQGLPIIKECFVIATDGLIMGYDYSCGTDVVVPAKIAGIEVKKINQTSFMISNVQMYYLYNEITEDEKQILYYTDESTKEAFVNFAKQMMCENPETCTLDDLDSLGITIITTEEEYNAIDWDGYEASGYTIEGPSAGYFNLETGELDDAYSRVTKLDLSKTIYLETIGESSFQYSGNLEEVILPQNGKLSTIENYAFENTNLSSMIIPSSVISIGESCFKYTNIREIIIPSSVVTIGNDAFANNEMVSLTFEDTEENPSQLTTIGDAAFIHSKLDEIVIPSSVNTIGNNAFSGEWPHTGVLTSIVIKDSIENPSKLTSIGGGAFAYNNLTELTIPDSVKNIRNHAFYANLLQKIKIGSSVESIGDQAFEFNQLTEVTIPASVKTIGNSAFSSRDDNIYYEENNIKTLIFEDTEENPSQLTNIGDNAFNGNQLTSLVIPNNVIEIDISAFEGNQLTGTLVIPPSVKIIRINAFMSNPNLTEVIIKNTEGNIDIDDLAFNNYSPTITYNPNYTE